jgi:hypothetical protein
VCCADSASGIVLIVLHIVNVWLVALALLFVAGYGISRWLTPAILRPYELLLMPLWGYGLIVFVAYYGLSSVVPLRGALWIVVCTAALLALWRLLRPGAAGRLPRAALRETLIVAGIALLGGVVESVPLLRAGYLAPIGHGWDIEFYLPLARYLQDYTYAGLAQAPPAPLLNVIQAEPTSVRAIGFSYLHGLLDLVGGWSPAGSFPLLLALIRAIAVGPVYLFLRVGLRARERGAALGALLVALNPLLLWISYNNFAMHASSMPLVPLATLLTILALRPSDQPETATRWRCDSLALAGAVAATTTLTLSYHPALLAYGTLAAGVGLWALLTNHDKLATIVRGAAIIAGCLALGFLAHWRAPRAFFDVYRAQTPSIGGERFARLTELLGVETFHHLPLAVAQPQWLTIAGWIALALLLLGVGLALSRGLVDPGPALGLLALALLYTLGLRFVIAFPYGFFKGVSYLHFVPLGIAAVGLAGIPDLARQRPAVGRIPALLGGAAAVLLVLSMTGWSTYRLLMAYRAPVLAGAEVTALVNDLGVLLRDGTVQLVDHPELRGPALGIAALGLYGHPWVGRGRTGFGEFDRPSPGTQAAYALMHASADPREWGFDPLAIAARRGSMVLYQATPGATAFLSGNSTAYTSTPESLDERLTSLQVQNLAHGAYRSAAPEQPLRLYAASDRLSWQPLDQSAQAGSPRRLILEIASSTAQTLTLSYAGRSQSWELSQGVSRVTTDAFPAQGAIEILPASDTLLIRSAQLHSAQAQTLPAAQPLSDTVALATATETQAPTIATTITLTSAQPEVVQLSLELYEISRSTPRRYAGGSFGLRANEAALLKLDLQTPAATLNGGNIDLSVGDLKDGAYFGALWLYQGTRLARRVPFVQFERRDGQIVNVQPLDANATFAQLSQPQQPIEAGIGPALLEGYTLEGSRRAGAALRLGIQWRINEAVTGAPLQVFAQILGPDDHKWAAWDGLAGGDWWASPAWQPRDRIWQEIPLQVDPATPPGRYRLVIGLYNAATGERVTVSGPDTQGGLLLLQELEIEAGAP